MYTLLYVGSYYVGMIWITIAYSDIEDENFKAYKGFWILYTVFATVLFIVL